MVDTYKLSNNKVCNATLTKPPQNEVTKQEKNHNAYIEYPFILHCSPLNRPDGVPAYSQCISHTVQLSLCIF